MSTIDIERVDHVGIRVKDWKRAAAFYEIFGFETIHAADNDAVVVIRNPSDVEINLIYNAKEDTGGKNILMDVPEKYAGFTHLALRVGSVTETLKVLKQHGIQIRQGPVTFGDGHVSIFIRDPDLNVIELRGRQQPEEEIEGLETYDPKG